jgi:aminopeptidase N
MVANDETEHAWMDEGFNTYSTARVIGQVYAPSHLVQRFFGNFVPFTFKDIVVERETFGNRLQGFRRSPKADTPSTPAYKYFPATASSVSYNKTALWLNTMERWLGWPVTRRILSTYFERWKFKHPGPNDFFHTVTEVAGKDLGWFFDQVHRSSNAFDYGVEAFESRREGNRYRTTLVVRRYGEAVFPVDVLVTFKDGERQTARWEGRDRWKLYVYERPAQALSAAVDPDRVLLLDVNYTNNTRTLQPTGAAAATKWSMKWMVWLQDHLLSWALFV